MAAARRCWFLYVAAAALFASASLLVQPQPPPGGVLSGKLTDLHSTPVGDATLVVRNLATGAEMRTTTQRNGAYRILGLAPGTYAILAESETLGRGRLEGIVLSAGQELRLQIAMAFEPVVVVPVDPAKFVFHPLIEPDAPPPSGEIPLRAIAAWVAPERSVWEIARVLPATAGAIFAASVPSEELSRLPLAGRSVWESTRIQPATQAPALDVYLSREPVQQLSLAGRNLSELPPPPQSEQPTILPASESAPSLVRASLGGAASSAQLRLAALGQLAVGGYGFAAGVAAMSVLRAALEAQPPLPKHTFTFAGSDPAAPAASTSSSGEQLRALPAAGRRWQDFVLDSTQTAPARADGRDASSPPVSIDGASRTLAFGSTEGGWRQGRSGILSEAAIREVQTLSGRTGAGGVGIETRSGENRLHGQVFVFDRQNIWGAQNPFTQWVRESAPATLTAPPVFTPQPYTPPDHETAWGIGLGGRIRRNRLFWFAALDGFQRNDPGLATVKHPDQFFAQPSNDQMQVLSARLGLNAANPMAEALSAYSGMLETLDGLLGPSARTDSQWTGFARVDWDATERNRFALEGTGSRWNSPGGGFSRVEEPYGNHSFGSSQATDEWLLARWKGYLTPNLLATTQASAGRTVLSARPQAPSPFEQTMVQRFWNQLPEIVVDSRYGFTMGNPTRFGPGDYPDEHLYQVQETVNWVRGGMLLKAGVDFRHNFDATSLLRNQTGTYVYSNVENFVSDALVFAKYGLAGSLDKMYPRNCDSTGKTWRDSAGGLHGLGPLPCYSYYSQQMGPANWWLSSNNGAAFVTAQWQPNKLLVLSAGLRWERQQTPGAIPQLNNPDLPLAQKPPVFGNNWGPRFGLALGPTESHWPLLRLGYGIYFGRTQNAVLETALTQTGSPNGDMNFFMRPTDNLNAGGAPPFPYVLEGEPSTTVKPGAVEFAPGFRNSQIQQATAGLEESLPSHIQMSATALLSLGRRLPVSIDTNVNPATNPGQITYAVIDASGAGPIKTPQIAVPFYASWPTPTGAAGRLNANYQQITQLESRANSTYEAAVLRVDRYGRRGLTLHARYTYAHAMDWNPDQSAQVSGSSVLDPAHFSEEYGVSDLDMRHAATGTVLWNSPWKLRNPQGRWVNGWMLSAIGHFRSGLPYTMRTSSSLAEEFNAQTGAAIVALGPGMNGSGGDNRVYGVGRNTYRYPAAWKADLRLGKRFDLGRMRELELLAESFNLFNHRNVTEVETIGYSIEAGTATSLPTLHFMTGLKANTTAFGQPLNVNATNFYRERQVQFGLRLRF